VNGPFADTIVFYAKLDDEYELQERASALNRKLTVIADTAQALTDLIDTKRSHRLEEIIIVLAGRLLLVIGLTLAELFLRSSDDAEIVLGVLIIIFRCNRVPGALRVTGKLKILFGDMGRRTADFYVRPVGLVHSR